MQIESIRLENFRSYKDQTIRFDDYTCLVGPNGAGKSTVLCALNLFFRNAEGSSVNVDCLERDDFYRKETDHPVRVTVSFVNLSEEAQADLADYYRGEKLIVSTQAVWSDEKKAPVFQHGQRLIYVPFARFFEKSKDGAKVDELRGIYAELCQTHSDLRATAKTKVDMEAALKTYEASRPELCSPVQSSDQFYGWSKGLNRLSKHIQWVYVPAVKDASDEQVEAKNTALGRLLARTVRAKINFADGLKEIRQRALEAYQQLMTGEQGALGELSVALGRRFGEWAHPDTSIRLEWRQDPDRTVRIEEPLTQVIAGEGAFEGDLLRFGHGLQRSFLLALLQELASLRDEAAPSLVIGIEEPELYQHPPQAKHLANVLERLSSNGTQVIVCTHSPYFAAGPGFSSIRLIRKDRSTAGAYASCAALAEVQNEIDNALPGRKRKLTLDGITARIVQGLQPALCEMFFAPTVILVEGLEDVAYLHAYFNLTDQVGEFRRLGCHVVPVNGKEHLVLPLAISKRLGLRTFTVCDSDSNPYSGCPDESWSEPKNEKHRQASEYHQHENIAIQYLSERKECVPFLNDDLWEGNLVMWFSNIGETFRADIEPAALGEARSRVLARYGQPPNMDKNAVAISDLSCELWVMGERSSKMIKLCSQILKFAQS